MADDTIQAEPGSTVDSATVDTAAPGKGSGESNADAPGFDKESFGEMLNRVTSEKPDKEAEPIDDTPEPEKLETKTDEPKKDEKAPEAAKTEEVEEVDEDAELELLSDEEIDAKHPKAPKALRDYAKRISKEYAPYVETVNELGGIEAVKRLDKMATVALGVPDMKEGGNLDQFHDYVKSLNPEFLEAYNKKLFYSAIDDPKDAEALLTPFIQADEKYKDLKFSDLKELADLVVDGEIDLEAIREKRDAERPEEAEKRRLAAEKETANEAEKADMRRRLDEGDARAQKEATDKELVTIWEKYQTVAAPVWKQFGLGKDFIKDSDPAEIKGAKQAYLDDLNNAIGRRLSANSLFQDLAKRLGQKERGDGYAYLVDRCAHIYKGVVREEALKRNGLLSGFLKSYGQPVKDTKTRRPEPEVDARTAAHARAREEEERETPAHEEGGLGKLIARKSQVA